jgi:hypothetical protein
MKLDPLTEVPVFERMKSEVLRDIERGIVPADVNSFSTLHDYVDANEYGGACEGDFNANHCEFWNRLQNAVDSWLRSRLAEGAK